MIFDYCILIAVQAGLLTFVAVVGAYSDGDDPAKCPAVEPLPPEPPLQQNHEMVKRIIGSKKIMSLTYSPGFH